MDFIMAIVRRAVTTSIGLFWSGFVALQCVRLAVTRPRKFFSLKRRTEPPPCLNDNTLGTHGYVQLKKVKLHYVSNGDENKPLMLCLHGFPEFWYSWRHQLREFSKEYRVVAVDQRGYSDSDKLDNIADYRMSNLTEDIKEFINALGYDKCVLVGHDWGGAVTWAFTLTNPQMVDRLIVCNCPHPSAMAKYMATHWKQFLMSWYMFFFCVPYFPEWYLTSGDMKFLENALTGDGMGVKRKEMITAEDMEAYKYSFCGTDKLYGPVCWYRAAMFYPQKLKLKHIPESVPTLLVWGTKDGALSTEMAELSGQYCKNFTLRYVEGASHWVQQEEPEKVNEHIWSFLKQSPTASTSKL